MSVLVEIREELHLPLSSYLVGVCSVSCAVVVLMFALRYSGSARSARCLSVLSGRTLQQVAASREGSQEMFELNEWLPLYGAAQECIGAVTSQFHWNKQGFRAKKTNYLL